MFGRKIFLLIACVLVTTGSGCITRTIPTSTTIESDRIQAFVEDPSRSSLPMEHGDNIGIILKEAVNISSLSVSVINVNIIDLDTTRIKGKVLNACCVADDELDMIRGNIVEVNLSDIDRISATKDKNKFEYDAEAFGWIFAIIFWIAVL